MKGTVRKCTHCRNNGHNARTCSKGCFKLFGVNILDQMQDQAVKKSSTSNGVKRRSYSVGNLQSLREHFNGGGGGGGGHHDNDDEGYLSDGPIHTNHKRKKGKPWTEEEHRVFLEGLQFLGKGDWKGISKNFVKTRTPTQVASHAQKYFLRLANDKKNRRTSLFDMPLMIKESSSTSRPPRATATPSPCNSGILKLCPNLAVQIPATTGLLPTFGAIPYMYQGSCNSSSNIIINSSSSSSSQTLPNCYGCYIMPAARVMPKISLTRAAHRRRPSFQVSSLSQDDSTRKSSMEREFLDLKIGLPRHHHHHQSPHTAAAAAGSSSNKPFGLVIV